MSERKIIETRKFCDCGFEIIEPEEYQYKCSCCIKKHEDACNKYRASIPTDREESFEERRDRINRFRAGY